MLFLAWDVLSGVTKTAWDVLSGVANRCGMFCPGWQKMAWDVLSRDVLSYIRLIMVSTFLTFDLHSDMYMYALMKHANHFFRQLCQ